MTRHFWLLADIPLHGIKLFILYLGIARLVLTKYLYIDTYLFIY